MSKNKKSAKILLGILLMITFTREGFRGYKETGDFVFFLTMTVLAIIFCGLLIRSAYKTEKVSVVENKYESYGWDFLKIFSILALIGLFLEIAGLTPSAPIKKIWTEALKNSVKEQITEEVMAKHQDSVLNVSAFGDCVVAKLTTYPPDSMHSATFIKSAEFAAIVIGCKKSCRKN